MSLFAETDTKPELIKLAKKAEFWETPAWAPWAILRRELLTKVVRDPCCGSGVISIAALRAGYDVESSDLYDWGYTSSQIGLNFLTLAKPSTGYDFTDFYNPPFSLATEFIQKSFDDGARKVLCFQRLEWWESLTRRPFFESTPPNRVYICGNRADCWIGTIPLDERGNGQKRAHAWFVWERGNPQGTQVGHIWKDDVKCL
ncbi:MAG: hypothetical protein OQJ97_18595 [Rhodospirillales bacterium]|nr:hypothetical protein [Rhodospirillales bacterium]